MIWSDLLTGMVPQIAGQRMSWEKQGSTNPGSFGHSTPCRSTDCQTFLFEVNLETAQMGSSPPWHDSQSWTEVYYESITLRLSLRGFPCASTAPTPPPPPRDDDSCVPGAITGLYPPPPPKEWQDDTRCLLPEGLKFKKGLTSPNKWVFEKPRSAKSQAYERLV